MNEGAEAISFEGSFLENIDVEVVVWDASVILEEWSVIHEKLISFGQH